MAISATPDVFHFKTYEFDGARPLYVGGRLLAHEGKLVYEQIPNKDNKGTQWVPFYGNDKTRLSKADVNNY